MLPMNIRTYCKVPKVTPPACFNEFERSVRGVTHLSLRKIYQFYDLSQFSLFVYVKKCLKNKKLQKKKL